MKKSIFTCGILLAASITGYSQFTDLGYQNLQLGMSEAAAKEVVSFTTDPESSSAIVNYDNIEMELVFLELEEGQPILYGISSNSPNTTLFGVNQSFIGSHYDDVIAILGDRLKAFESDGPSTEYFIFYKDKTAKSNLETSCVLQFDENNILIRIIAAYNP